MGDMKSNSGSVSQFLEGFKITMDLPEYFLKKDFTVSELMAFIKTNPTTGTLTHLETYTLGKQPMWVLIAHLGT